LISGLGIPVTIELISAHHVYGTLIYVKFNNNDEGIIDLRPILIGNIFDEIYNNKIFEKFIVNSESGTIEWPNGADIAPEVLHSSLLSKKNSKNDFTS
jgi:hypothetical protein